MASQLHYLTVQDILWINLQITEKVNGYSFAKLEEATYYQYAYGESRQIESQAARFLKGFPKMQPLDQGNDSTTFVALITFLKLNGLEINLTDAKAGTWYRSVQTGETTAAQAVGQIAKSTASDHHHATDVRAIVRDVLKTYAKTLKSLD